MHMRNGHRRAKAIVTVTGPTMTFDEVRGTLSDEIRRLRSGKTTASNINAISNACGKLLASVRTEIELCKFTGRQPKVAGLIATTEASITQSSKQKRPAA